MKNSERGLSLFGFTRRGDFNAVAFKIFNHGFFKKSTNRHPFVKGLMLGRLVHFGPESDAGLIPANI